MKTLMKSSSIGYIASDTPPSTEYAYVFLKKEEGIKPLQYLVAKTKRNGKEYGVILRVQKIISIDKASRSAVIDLEEKTGLRLPEKLYEQLPGRYKLAKTEVIDAYEVSNDEGTIKVRVLGPSIPPEPRAPVYPIDEIAMRVLTKKVEHPLLIGKLVGSSVPVALEANDLLRHVCILGGTGTGKSWLRGVLMEELAKLKIPQVNFDYLGEYVEATEQLGGINLTLGEDYRPRLDMLSPREFSLMIQNYVPTPFQLAIAQQGFADFRRRSLNALQPLPPSKLIDYIRAAAISYNAREDTLQNVTSRVKAFLQDFDIFGESIDWKHYLEKYKLINIVFEYADEDLIRIGVAATLKELMILRRLKKIPCLITSFEEAHMIIPRGEKSIASVVVKRLLRYGRHLGIGVILITQKPNSIDQEGVSMPATKIVFALSHDELRYMRGLFSDLGEEIYRRIPKLEVGTAVISGTYDILRHSLYVRIRSDRKTKHGGETPRLLP